MALVRALRLVKFFGDRNMVRILDALKAGDRAIYIDSDVFGYGWMSGT